MLRLLSCLALLFVLSSGCAHDELLSSNGAHGLWAAEKRKSALRAYDARICDAVSTRWLQLLEERGVPQDNGVVVVTFKLTSNGQVTELGIPENTEGLAFGLVCQKAILDPAPYPEWPADVRKIFGKSRRFRFTFQFDSDGQGYLAYVENWEALDKSLGQNPQAQVILYIPEKREQAAASDNPWGSQIQSRRIFEFNRNGPGAAVNKASPATPALGWPYWPGDLWRDQQQKQFVPDKQWINRAPPGFMPR